MKPSRKDAFSLSSKRRWAQKESESSGLDGRLVTIANPASAASEAYRNLLTILLYSFIDYPPKVIVLTSPNWGEGKTTTCANLGVVLAQAGKRTLIVDCDLRRSTLHKFFGLPNTSGVVDVLVLERSLQEVWTEPIEGLKVVPAGPIAPNPTELLTSRRLSHFLDSARRELDYVLVDAPPVGLISDAVILATQGDGVLLILDAQNTRKNTVRRSMRTLEAVGARVLGTVMTNVPRELC